MLNNKTGKNVMAVHRVQLFAQMVVSRFIEKERNNGYGTVKYK